MRMTALTMPTVAVVMAGREARPLRISRCRWIKAAGETTTDNLTEWYIMSYVQVHPHCANSLCRGLSSLCLGKSRTVLVAVSWTAQPARVSTILELRRHFYWPEPAKEITRSSRWGGSPCAAALLGSVLHQKEASKMPERRARFAWLFPLAAGPPASRQAWVILQDATETM